MSRYRKRYAVDELCAVVELRMLGVEVPDARLEQARRNERDRAARRARRRQGARPEDFGGSDETFAFIAGYTDGGAPYGITWEEMERGDAEPSPAPDAAAEDAWRWPDDAVHEALEGRIGWGGVAVDGRFVRFADLLELIQVYEGFHLSLRIVAPTAS